jgi:hypothetical protein
MGDVDSMSAEQARVALEQVGIEVTGDASVESMRSALKASVTGEGSTAQVLPPAPPAAEGRVQAQEPFALLYASRVVYPRASLYERLFGGIREDTPPAARRRPSHCWTRTARATWTGRYAVLRAARGLRGPTEDAGRATRARRRSSRRWACSATRSAR